MNNNKIAMNWPNRRRVRPGWMCHITRVRRSICFGHRSQARHIVWFPHSVRPSKWKCSPGSHTLLLTLIRFRLARIVWRAPELKMALGPILLELRRAWRDPG
jgi:hypothetical protein